MSVTKQDKMVAKKKGRPATGQGTPVMVRLQPDLLADLDKFILERPMSRPEAIRLLTSDALIGMGIRKVGT